MPLESPGMFTSTSNLRQRPVVGRVAQIPPKRVSFRDMPVLPNIHTLEPRPSNVQQSDILTPFTGVVEELRQIEEQNRLEHLLDLPEDLGIFDIPQNLTPSYFPGQDLTHDISIRELVNEIEQDSGPLSPQEKQNLYESIIKQPKRTPSAEYNLPSDIFNTPYL